MIYEARFGRSVCLYFFNNVILYLYCIRNTNNLKKLKILSISIFKNSKNYNLNNWRIIEGKGGVPGWA